MGGLTFEKLIIVVVIALIVIGPEKLPGFAHKLGELVRNVKRMADGAKDRLREEMGPEFDEVNWKQLDPRQYDPRRIIRDALLEDEREAHAEARKARAVEAARARQRRQQGVDAESASGLGVAVSAAVGESTITGSEAQVLYFDDQAT